MVLIIPALAFSLIFPFTGLPPLKLIIGNSIPILDVFTEMHTGYGYSKTSSEYTSKAFFTAKVEDSAHTGSPSFG